MADAPMALTFPVFTNSFNASSYYLKRDFFASETDPELKLYKC